MDYLLVQGYSDLVTQIDGIAGDDVVVGVTEKDWVDMTVYGAKMMEVPKT